MKNEDNPGVIAFPPLLAAITLFLGVASHFLRAVDLPPHGPLRVAGIAALAIAFGLLLAASSTRVRLGTNVDPSLPALRIVSQGPYRFTRNPMYLSLCLLAAGSGLLLCDLMALLLTIPLLGLLHYGVVLREERYLAAKFGDAYASYRAGVRRWI